MRFGRLWGRWRIGGVWSGLDLLSRKREREREHRIERKGSYNDMTTQKYMFLSVAHMRL